MKNYKNKLLIVIGVIALFASCKKYEVFPVDRVTTQYAFDKGDSDGVQAQLFLFNIYADLRSGHSRVGLGGYLDAATDDAVESSTSPQIPVTILSTAAYNSSNLPTQEDIWGKAYSAIRNSSIFINNIDVVPTRSKYHNIPLKYIWKSEARFLRAYQYFELVKRYGGVPLMGDKVYNISDNIEIPRSSFSDCINYIVNECDAIKDSLIQFPDINLNADVSRATKGAALALKARALLFAASPLFNGGNIDPANPLTGYTDFSADRWNKAAQAAKDVINLGVYKLTPGFSDWWLQQNTGEMIFIVNSDIGNGIESAQAPINFPPPVGLGQTSPTQQLVDAFPMKNGLDINAPGSGYDPKNPYANRDPRFPLTVFYNGHPWLNGVVATYEGGQSKPNLTQTQTRTSYYMRKFMNNSEATATISTHSEDWPIFRYAGVLLDYAEAQNEFAGPSQDVYDQLIAVRKRAGIAAGTDPNFTYGLKLGMSQDEMRTAIRNEKRIELAFEENRYFDIRRWKIAETVMNVPMDGMLINKVGNDFTYNRIDVLNTKFIAPKMYLYPINYDEVVKNSNMKQNPGWER